MDKYQTITYYYIIFLTARIQFLYTLNMWLFYDTVINMCLTYSIVNLYVYMYIRLSVRVTCFLLFEALVEDWHVKRVASWNIVLNLITVTAVYIYEKWCYFIWQTPSCFIVHLCHLCWFCVQCFTVQVKQAIEMLVFYFGVPLLSVLPGHSGFFIPATTANDLRLRRIFYPRLYPLQLFSYLNPFECSVLNKGTTGTIL